MSTLPPDSPTPPSESHGEQVPRRVSAETALQFLVASKASSEGATDLVSLARLVAETFNVTSAVLVRRQGRLPLAAWSRGQPHLPPAPVPHGTLLDLVFDRGLYHLPRDADTKAEDVWPRLLGRCGFLGMALKSAAGEVLGAIVLYDDGPLEVGPSDLALLDVFTLRAVAALERSEPVRSLTRDFLLNLLDNLQVPILIKDGQHRYVSMNDAFCRFMDRDRETLLHKSDADFMSPQDARIFQGYDEQVFSSGKPHEYEAAFTDRVTGELRKLFTLRAGFLDAQGRHLLVCVIRDLTAYTHEWARMAERRALEAQARRDEAARRNWPSPFSEEKPFTSAQGHPQLMRVLRDSPEYKLELARMAERVETLRRLIAGIYNEVRSPLSVLLSSLPFLRENLERPDAMTVGLTELRELVGDSLECVKRIEILMNGLGRFAREHPDETHASKDLNAFFSLLEQEMRGEK
ncbi:PAS domain S-box-containing protein [Archangium gephyra]|uniref:PAS domain S-box-containing protein n=1 Tax=Archangium gephyra TaxID=48 RepID=A0AAC8QBJ2_9BACT|nr:PAS domain-containing protein [Archangium gephyra]AKJ04026.1 Sensory box/GGDEF family protein [Archangium gephyra]REG37889.1 PAS domain S-box-containing protein [Archangium gephyra]